MSDAKLVGPACECGDAFCSGCDAVVKEEADAGIDRGGIMDHVLTCSTCGYQTNVVGDMTDHRLGRHRRPKVPNWSSKPQL